MTSPATDPGAAGFRPAPNRPRTPMLLRATMVAGLVAAAGVSALRAYDGGLSGQAEATLGPGTTAVAAQVAPLPVQACRVSHTVTSRSPGRFTAVLTIVNRGSTDVQGWALSWTYPGVDARSAPRLSNGWNAAVASDAGGGRAVGIDQSRVIPAGGSTTIGFVGTRSAEAVPAPSGFRLNEVACR